MVDVAAAITQEDIDKMIWHHSIDFGNGLVSKGGGSLEITNGFAHALLNGINLKGKALLDVGAWNGAYSFAAKKAGASRVVASDKYCWVHDVFKGRETFELGLILTGLDIEAVEIDVPDIAPETVGMFDAVLFSGVFYHLLTPVYLTKRVSSCAKHLFILETHQDLLNSPKPGMIFYPGDTLNGDPTNWWGPNPQCVYEILQNSGFSSIFYQDSPGYNIPGSPLFRTRGIYHAFRDEKSVVEMGADPKSDIWFSLSDANNREEVFRPLCL